LRLVYEINFPLRSGSSASSESERTHTKHECTRRPMPEGERDV
jgi:hypothetical protein